MVELKTGTVICVKNECKKKFEQNVEISLDDMKKCFNFAYSMATGNKHNVDSFMSGNYQYERSLKEVFRDAFQGKVAEIAFYNYYSKTMNVAYPNFDEWERGVWEDTDFCIEDKNQKKYQISVKSTKDYGNFLLLEKNRYDENGLYKEGTNHKLVKHDLIFLVRISGISNLSPKYYVENNFRNIKNIKAELTGYITHNDFKKAIKGNKCFLEGYLINTCEPLKVDNYYFCVGELTKPTPNT